MAKIEKELHISNAAGEARRRVRSQSEVRVPRYSLYGDASSAREWFVNVEPLDQRARALEWKIEPHTHPKFTQIVFVQQGRGEITLDGDTFGFTGPSVLVIPPFRIHSICYDGPAEGWVVTIENNYLGDLLGRAPDLRMVLEKAGAFALSAPASATIAASVVELRGELAQKQKGSMIGAEIQLLQLALAMLRGRPAAETSPPTARAALVDRFLELVEAGYDRQPDIDVLASELGVTTAQLRNACKATTGLSPLAILHDRIAAEAKRCLIYTTMSVCEIGYSLGFNDAAYFTRFFTRVLGVTPTKFRSI